MKSVVSVTLFLSYMYSEYTKEPNDMKVELVQVLFRHGERAPTEAEYNVLNYTNLSAYEPFGLEHLTNTGKQQAYKIGTMLRERYKDYLNDLYKPNDVYARSTEDDRTRMSLLLVLAGLYPPTKEFQWNPQLDWMPIPYRYISKESDILLKTQHSKKLVQLYFDVWKSPWGLEKLAEYADVFDFFKELGINVQPNLLRDLIFIHNLLLINGRMNLPLPEWYTDDLNSKLQQVLLCWLDSKSFTEEMKRLNGGPVIRTFIENMNLNKTVVNPRQIYLYSGHDLNIAGVVSALNIKNFAYWDFCSTFILEKLRDVDGQVYVRLLGWNGVEEKLSVLKMDTCEEICPIDDFLKITRNVIPSDEELLQLLDKGADISIHKLLIDDPLVKPQ